MRVLIMHEKDVLKTSFITNEKDRAWKRRIKDAFKMRVWDMRFKGV